MTHDDTDDTRPRPIGLRRTRERSRKRRARRRRRRQGALKALFSHPDIAVKVTLAVLAAGAVLWGLLAAIGGAGHPDSVASMYPTPPEPARAAAAASSVEEEEEEEAEDGSAPSSTFTVADILAAWDRGADVDDETVRRYEQRIAKTAKLCRETDRKVAELTFEGVRRMQRRWGESVSMHRMLQLTAGSIDARREPVNCGVIITQLAVILGP